MTTKHANIPPKLKSSNNRKTHLNLAKKQKYKNKFQHTEHKRNDNFAFINKVCIYIYAKKQNRFSLLQLHGIIQNIPHIKDRKKKIRTANTNTVISM